MGENSEYYKSKTHLMLAKSKKLLSQLPSYVKGYAQDVEQARQESTLCAYLSDLIIFFNWICASNPLCYGLVAKDVPIEVLGKLTADDIREYKDFLMDPEGHNNNKQSAERKLAPVRGLYNSLVSNESCGEIVASPVAQVGLKQKKNDKKSDIKRLRDNEVESLKRAAKFTELGKKASPRAVKINERLADRDSAIINLFLDTGIRVSELQGLDVTDYSFENKALSVVRKGGFTSNIYLSDEMNAQLNQYVTIWRELKLKEYGSDSPALFISSRGTRISIRAIQQLVNKYGTSANGKKLSPHSLRRTYGTSLYAKTQDIKLVADNLGHSSVDTTSQRYAATNEQNRQDAANITLYDTEEASSSIRSIPGLNTNIKKIYRFVEGLVKSGTPVEIEPDILHDNVLASLASSISAVVVRNSKLEDVHTGKCEVEGFHGIPNELMVEINRSICNRMYTLLTLLFSNSPSDYDILMEKICFGFGGSRKWDFAEIDEELRTRG